jgi:hypothetical protein
MTLPELEAELRRLAAKYQAKPAPAVFEHAMREHYAVKAYRHAADLLARVIEGEKKL